MSNFTRHLLSGSTNGKQIKITQTATVGDTIHAAVTGANNIDMIYLYACNITSTSPQLTIEWGGVTVPDDNIEIYDIAPESGYELIIPGLPLQNGLLVTVFASTANVILINGYVDRYTA